MREMFNDILEKDEEIVNVFKPDKKKFKWSMRLIVLASTFWLYFGAFISLDPENEAPAWQIALIIIGCVTALIILAYLIVMIFANIFYKNKFYAYTNKRILVRGGIFGIDYKSLEFKSLTATIVNVSLIDKIIKRNTGSIMFGSPSSPVGSVGPYGSTNPYAFKHIIKPYETLKEIKETINQTEATQQPTKDAKKSALDKLTAEEKAALGLTDNKD